MSLRQARQVSDYAGASAPWQLSSSRLLYIAKVERRGPFSAHFPGQSGRGPAITTGPGLYFRVPSARTNRETEIKLRVTDIRLLIARLKGLGAAARGRVFEQNTLYDTPKSHLWGAGCLLRVRTERPAGSSLVAPGLASAVLTYKAPLRGKSHGMRSVTKPRYKERLEREVPIQHANRWHEKLKALGFLPGFRYEKYRSSFRLPKLHIDLDETPIGTILELEGTPEAIERAAHALGYEPRDYIRATYWDLYAADCKRQRRAPRNMVFDK
jgi:adenylate cyclase class 2